MQESTKGIIAMFVACTIWGCSALYYLMIAHVPPLEVLAHRTVWSAVVLFVWLAFNNRLSELVALLITPKAMLYVGVAAVLVSSNWFVFIYSVQVGYLAESSLGYYMFPLITVMLGYVFLGERLSRQQWFAVSLAFIAIVVLTLGLGVAPWISLFLGGTFGFYSLVKKPLQAGPTITVMGEVVLLVPLALIWLWGVHTQGWQGISGREGGYFGQDWRSMWLILSGPLTAIPLVMMAYAIKRLSLSSVGLVQYVNPSLQFVIAAFVFTRPITQWHLIAFALIWVGLAVYSYDAWRQDKAR